MPVDLSPAGRPHAYPRPMRFWPWAATWLVCNVFGPVVVLLVWPKGEPASGLKFWGWIVGAPNGLFLILFGFSRAVYETLWYRAYWCNHHRDRWLADEVRFAQHPLKVIGAGYCLPLGGKRLSDVLAAKRSILKVQAPRHGAGKVSCSRFEDNDPRLAVASDVSEEEGERDNLAMLKKVSSAARMICVALEPLAGRIQALTRYERPYWPQVRVLAEPELSDLRRTQVRDALRLAALPPLEVQAVTALDGLMVADAWLDARESRPLLLVAAAWYDDGIEDGLAEGCAAVLLDAGYFRLPPEVRAQGLLHRPVAGVAAEAEYGFANAAVWGKTDAATVTGAWITRPVANCDRALHAAGFVAAVKDSQRRLDLLVGNLRAANGLLAIAAMVESGVADGPQLVVDGLQSAILHVIPSNGLNA